MAEVTTSGKVIQKPDVVLEPDDFLPPGLIGVRTKTKQEVSDYDLSSTQESIGMLLEESSGDPDGEGGDNNPTYDTLPIPTEMKIISQTIRVGPDGKMLVDVVIETPDFPGITEFEARLTRDE